MKQEIKKMANNCKESNNYEFKTDPGVRTRKNPSKYIDDMTLLMAWQNYHLLNYSWSSYCYVSMLNCSRPPIHIPHPNANAPTGMTYQQQAPQYNPMQQPQRREPQEQGFLYYMKFLYG